MRTAVLLLLLLVPAGALAQQTSSPHSAEYCGDCHRAIYDGWKQSAHAAAMESRLFQDALKMADSEFGSEARKVCLRCHSPVAGMVDDFALIRKVSGKESPATTATPSARSRSPPPIPKPAWSFRT